MLPEPVFAHCGGGTSLNPFGATSFQTKIDIVLQRYPALVLGLRISPIPIRKGFPKLLFHLSHEEPMPGEQGPGASNTAMPAAHTFSVFSCLLTCFVIRGSMNFCHFHISLFIYQALQGAAQSFFFVVLQIFHIFSFPYCAAAMYGVASRSKGDLKETAYVFFA